MIVEDVIWSVASNSSGTIDSNGLYTPELVGTQYISVCFGVICAIESISVTPGAPTQLVVNETSVTITADDTYEIIALVIDQHGNQVFGETITYQPTNGSMMGTTFHPYNSGIQTVTVGWSVQSIDVEIEVLGGEPVYYETVGCETVIKAGKTCELNWTLYDQYGNMLDLADGGGITWTVGGGVFTESNGTFFAVTVGNYTINMSSTKGIYHEIPIQIDHGEMASLEINASASLVTADEVVWLNTTRIDVMGNRLAVEIPWEDWTI